MNNKNDQPIGVFDSGVGGLTVLKALHHALPEESFLYLGDMARLPYGSKSPETVQRYALQAASQLVQRGIKLLVVACNTASALALDKLQLAFPDMPVVGVVDPGAEAACDVSASGNIVVIATESTVRGGAYEKAIKKRRPEAQVRSIACPLFVALAEEGWHEGKIVESIIHEYLSPVLVMSPDTLVLGCTHFPVLAPAISKIVGEKVCLVDSASTTAAQVDLLLSQYELKVGEEGVGYAEYFTTDAPERFIRVAKGFLPAGLHPRQVTLLDL